MSDILERQGMKAEDLAHLTSPYIYPDPLQPGDSAIEDFYGHSLPSTKEAQG